MGHYTAMSARRGFSVTMEILHRDDRPTLYDLHIDAMSPQAFTLAGFERVEEAEYAQSWLCSG